MSLPTPNTRKEQYLNAIATGNAGGLPTPITREEEYLDAIAKSGGGGGGTTNYNALDNKPQIAGTTLQGNKSLTDLGIAGDDAVADIYAVMGEMGAKNLIPYPPYKNTTRSENGVTFTDIGDGTINVETDINGATANTYFVLLGSPNYYLLKKGTYILSDGTGLGDSITLQIFDSTPQHTTIVTTEYGDTKFTVEADIAVAIRLNIKSGCITTGTLVKPMLRLASDTDNTYQQYAKTNKQLTDEIANKVDKVEGKGLSTNDYDNTEKGKVADNTGAIKLLTSNEPADITNRLANLPTAVAQQNLEKYGYKIGDYFDGTNYRYWLGHLNYNYGGYDYYAVLGTLNIGLVVDTKSNSQWNTSNDTTGGYENSALHTYLKGTVLDNIKADLKSLFGGSTGLEHLIAETKLFATVGNWGWSSSAEYISALTEVNMYGCPIWSVDNFQQGEADQRLEIFRKYKYNRIFGNKNIWLRSIRSASEACLANYYGHADHGDASFSFGAAGLIIFH